MKKFHFNGVQPWSRMSHKSRTFPIQSNAQFSSLILRLLNFLVRQYRHKATPVDAGNP